MVKYNEVYCRKILKRNGWEPNLPVGHQLTKDWVLMALSIALLEKHDE